MKTDQKQIGVKKCQKKNVHPIPFNGAEFFLESRINFITLFNMYKVSNLLKLVAEGLENHKSYSTFYDKHRLSRYMEIAAGS